jgi:hypothetical protein
MPSHEWMGNIDLTDLRKHFLDPPREFSLLPFWAWNDTLEDDQLRWQIDEMLDKGVFGAFLHARSGIETSDTPYFSEGWWHAVQTAVEYGARKDFFAILYDEDKWPSGSAGGRVVSANPEYAKRGLKVEKWELSGPRTLTLDFSGDTLAILAGKLANQQSLDPHTIIDLTDQKDSAWLVPEGLWNIMHFSECLDTGIQIDYLNKAAVRTFIDLTHEEYYRRFGRHFGRTIPGIFFDEIYANLDGTDLVWSKDFLKEFQQKKGYDLKPYLPYLVYHAGPDTPRIRCDYFDTVTSLYTEAWFHHIASWCQDHKIWLTGHTLETIRDYQNQGNYFKTWNPVRIPGTDNEDYRYTFPRRVRWYKAKQLSSLVHTRGKQRAMVEALGGGGWVVSPHEYKIGLALLGVYGLNMFVPHLFHYSDERPECMDDWPPSWFFQNPYWKYFRKLADFGRRISFMGSLGKHVCDVGILYPITSLWAGGMNRKEDVGTLGGGETGDLLEIQYNSIQEILLYSVIDYDIIDPEAVTSSEVEGNRLHIADEDYAVLILPPITTIRRSVAEQIKAFFDEGGVIIALNQLPMHSMEQGENDGHILDIFNHVFNFDPRSLRIGYLETDTGFSQDYVVHTNAKGGKAYFAKAVRNIPAILHQCVKPDIEILSGNRHGLRVLHRSTAAGEVYFLVNEQKQPNALSLAIRASGIPELWDPETGAIKTLTNYAHVDGRLMIPLTLRPWDARYLVCHPAEDNGPAIMISHSNLLGTSVADYDAHKIVVEGWRQGNIDSINLELERPADGHRMRVSRSLKPQDCLGPVRLAGDWEFTIAPEELNEQWKPDISRSMVELPVMKVRWERQGEDGEDLGWAHNDIPWDDWRQVKIKDTHSPYSGCRRYLTSWDGAWINYYRYQRHWGVLGGEMVTFRRQLQLEGDIASGWLCLTADESFSLSLNGHSVGQGFDWQEPQHFDITPLLNQGQNVFLITVPQCKGLLLQGEILFTDGRVVGLISNTEWEASVDGGVWYPAFQYIYPPLGPWGNLPRPGVSSLLPAALWYRQYLPIGASAIAKPHIPGEYQLFVNGEVINFPEDRVELDISHLMSPRLNTLAVKVLAKEEHDGILEPLKIICTQGRASLGSWTDQGLSWYSGRAVYSREFDLQDLYLKSDIKLVLDLGDVFHCAEIWVNGKLVTYQPWPPFSADITSYVRMGRNEVSIVVANLLANRRQWEIHDCNLTELRSRFNHEGAVMRERECLRSGLLGPVQIVPYFRETIEQELTPA